VSRAGGKAVPNLLNDVKFRLLCKKNYVGLSNLEVLSRLYSNWEGVMDFIERLLNLSPDGGNGTFEMILVIAPLLIGALIWMKKSQTQQSN
jgi:hypothetical protein